MANTIETPHHVQTRTLNHPLDEGSEGQALWATEPSQAPPSTDMRGSSPGLASDAASLRKAKERLAAPPVGVDRCVHDLIDEQASQQPEAPAVCSWDGDLTYSSLNHLSSKLAHYLRTLGAGPERVIPFCFEKSLWAVVASVAILKSGSAFVAVDPLIPDKRRTSIIQETEATIVVTSPSQAGLFIGMRESVVVLSSAFIDSLKANDSKPCTEVGPRNAAFVLFTSGSTGQPKGIVQDHGAVCTMCSSFGKALYLDARCRVLQFASYSFDVSIVDIVDTLIHGACLCIPSDHDRRHNIVGAMNAMQVTWADLTPSYAATLGPQDVPTLRTLVLAGEEVQQAHIELWAGKVRLINCYGPAESSACTTYEYSLPSDRPGTIGYPMTHANCWVVDPNSSDTLASPETIGELVVESPALARGYLKNPEKTKASFIQDPEWLRTCKSVNGRRLYKSGDLVRYQSDGSLEFVGRKDNQIKIRGQRVELSEVEHLLLMYHAISKCIVAYPKSGPFGSRLVAVIQLRAVSRSAVDDDLRLLSQEQLRRTDFRENKAIEHLGKILPTYMIPTTWVTVESIPLTSSKKTDRRRVEDWLEETTQTQFLDRMGSSNMFDLHELDPQELIASRLSIIVAEGSHHLRKALEGHDFALSVAGIDSIRVISLSRRIEQEFNVKIGVERLTNYSTTIRGLATEIELLKDTPRGVEPTASVDVSREVMTLFQTLVPASPLHHEVPSVNGPVENVFLTGATGFLGTQILRQLLLRPSIKRIILHVRADDAAEGLERIIMAAKTAAWWSEPFTTQIEIWPGDLTKPRLGISSRQWQRLSGLALPEDNVHAIIHTGGVVRWNADYYTLKPANTLSTHELLQAASACPYGNRFVYISGGQRLSFSEEEDDDEALLAQVRGSSGYTVSKIASELLVRKFASTSHAGRRHHISVVKPSYIIGTVMEGHANPTDYLWRLVAGAVEIGAYNADEADNGWLFVSDVAHVARTTVHSALSTTASGNGDGGTQRPGHLRTTPIRDGLRLADFWRLLRTDFGYDLRGAAGPTWWSRMRTNVEATGPSHCLWPLSYMLEQGKGDIGSAAPPPPTTTTTTMERASLHDEEATERVKAAVRMNVRHLQEIGFLPTARTNPTTCSGEEGSSPVEVVEEARGDHECERG